MSKLAKALSAAAGNAGGTEGYVEDVFSTFLYQGNSSSPPTITNNIDLSGEGGMVWIKARPAATNHILTDTARGRGVELSSDADYAQQNYAGTYGINSFNSNGFSLIGANSPTNTSAYNYVSWTFRKAKKFCDVVTYSGNDVSGRAIAHNLGSVPGMMFVKQTNGTYNWQVYHTSLGNTKFLELNTTGAAQTNINVWQNTTPTDSVFTVGNEYGVNQSGKTYVAYLFASDAGGYGDAGDESIVKCGTYTQQGSPYTTVNLGWEPQYILRKRANSTSQNWYVFDTMRGLNYTASKYFNPNNTDAESSGWADTIYPTATGFFTAVGNPGDEIIYMAIRRGPMKIPEDATKVFAVDQGGNAGSATVMAYTAGFPVDAAFHTRTEANQNRFWSSRLAGAKYLLSNSTAAEASNAAWTFDSNTQYFNDYAADTSYAYMFQRAPGFMDVVAYSGTGTNPLSVNHSLTVAPELMITKRRNAAVSWHVGVPSISLGAFLNTADAFSSSRWTTDWANFSPTSTIFKVSDGTAGSGDTMVAYLFATLAGVSKVGSYTGNAGYAVNVPCGFSNGARFILIKRTDATADWYVYDTVRGITAGNDPYFFINTTAAQVTNTNYIAQLSSGFTVTASAPAGLNASSGNYIFLAIA